MTATLATLLPDAAYAEQAVPRLVDDALCSEEREHVRRAVPRRRAEFGTARVCARRGLAAMGFAPSPLVPGRDGCPAWPPGVVGSITHTEGYCAVALGRDPPVRSLGLDAETLRAIEPDVVARILTPREAAWIGRQPGPKAELALLFFSAKEAFYKCQYPVTRRFLDFDDVEIDVLAGEGRFAATLRAATAPALEPLARARIEGRFAFEDGRVLCGVEWLA